MSEKYQVFLSFKNLDENGKPTRDSVLAEELYRYLSEKELKVFLSNISLEKSGIAAFKQAINDALESSKILVAVGTSGENLESEWVNYEWDSFHDDILNKHKPNGKVFVYVEGIEISSLPRTLRRMQVIDHKRGGKEQLYRFIKNALKLDQGSSPKVAVPRETRRNDQETILRILYEYFVSNPEDNKMVFSDVCDKIYDDPNEDDLREIRKTLFKLKNIGWLDYRFVEHGVEGEVWIKPEGLKIAESLIKRRAE